MESRARGGDESLLATRLRHVHGHGRIAEVVSAVALDALAVNRWTSNTRDTRSRDRATGT